jgi:glutathionyl-hydroquinone reductase
MGLPISRVWRDRAYETAMTGGGLRRDHTERHYTMSHLDTMSHLTIDPTGIVAVGSEIDCSAPHV